MEVGTKRIETDRLILRRFRLTDAQNMYKNWCSDSKVTKFLSWQPQKSIIQTKHILRKWCNSYFKNSVYNWAIELKEIGEVIGSITVVKDRIKWQNGVKAVIEKEIGYCIGSNWWGKGIMSETLTAIVDFLFCNTDTTRICAKHNTENPASGKVMQKAGMIYEGTLRQYNTSNYGIEDVCIYSVLRTDYLSKITEI